MTTDGNPFPRPKSEVLLAILMVHKWSDTIDDYTRMILEWCEEEMLERDSREAELKRRLVRQALHLERAEARR